MPKDQGAGSPVEPGFLLKQAQAGDKKAFEGLVTLYQEKIYSLSYHLAGNPEDAQDLAQEAFIKAYLNLKKFRGDSAFGTWLHRITVNTWLNFNRRKKVEQLSLDEPVKTAEGEVARPVVNLDPAADPAAAAESKERQRYVWQALNSLSEDFRLVLVLREIEDFSYEEIASMLGCSLGTVKSRLNRGRRMLKDQLEDLIKKETKEQQNAVKRLQSQNPQRKAGEWDAGKGLPR